MPIDTQCPHCQKSYRLKDEAVGKKAICQNPECRKPFVVTALPPKATNTASARPKAAAKPAKAKEPPPPDAEAMAAAAFAEPGEAAPTDERTIALTCASCDHKWDVPWSMQGKNVLCPECRARQKVPEQKKVKPGDWRDSSGKPSLARQEQLEGVVASSEARGVSGRTLVESGVVKQEIEPRPKWHYFAVAAAVVVLLSGIGYGIVYMMQSSQDSKQSQFMANAVKDLQENTDSPLPPAEAPLYRATLYIAAGEYALRQDSPERLKEAVTFFDKARQELTSAPPNIARDLLFGELAVAQVALGGTEEQVQNQQRIRWKPQPARPGKGNAEGKTYNVQEELRATLRAMQNPDKQCPRDARLLAVRKAAQAIAKRGYTDELLNDSMLGQVFSPEEQPEATALVAVEMAKETKDTTKLAETAALVKSTASAQAALDAFEKPQEALNKAKDPASLPETRLKTLALLAELSSEPGPFVQSALDLMGSKEGSRKDALPSDFTLVRLAAQAGRANMADKVDVFANKTVKPEAKVWAKSEAVRQLLPVAYAGKSAEEALTDVPADSKDFKAGHAWARLHLARHNTAATGDQSAPTVAAYERWGKGTFKPFGLAGLALGLQDREKR